MARFVAEVDMPELPAGVEDETRQLIDRLTSNPGKENVADIRSTLQEEMMDKASVFRTAESLTSVLNTIRDLRAAYQHVGITDKGSVFNYDLTEAVELGFLIDLAESLVVPALARTESRGAHSRDDYPTRDDANWLKHSLVSRADDGTVTLDYKAVQLGKYEPMERKY
jgi:succinate dehydrogenase / fumarate reductase flavoprotein subunit